MNIASGAGRGPHAISGGVDTERVTTEELVESLRFYTANLVWLIVALAVFGLLIGYSASSTKLISEGFSPLGEIKSQILYTIIGLVVLFVASRFGVAIDGKGIRMYYFIKVFFWITVGLLALVLVAGESYNGARRSLELFGIYFQPAELAKFGLIAYLLHMLLIEPYMDWRGSVSLFGYKIKRIVLGDLGQKSRVLRGVFASALVVSLTLLQPNLGGALFLSALALTCFALSGARKRWLFLTVGIVAACACFILFAPIKQFGHAKVRWKAFTHPFGMASVEDSRDDPNQDTERESYQIIQSLGALASGGLVGKGLFKGVQKINRLPEATNDFIFSVICEEMGIWGALAVIAAFLALLAFIVGISLCIRNPFYSGLVFLIGFGIVLQAFINMGAAVNLLPTTGINLPLISFGGSSKVVTLFQLGVVLAVANTFLRFENPRTE